MNEQQKTYIFLLIYFSDSTRRELKDMMLDQVRNSSTQDGQKKCEIFESELKNAQQCLKSPACRQISALPTPPKISAGNENNTQPKVLTPQPEIGETEKENNSVSYNYI